MGKKERIYEKEIIDVHITGSVDVEKRIKNNGNNKLINICFNSIFVI